MTHQRSDTRPQERLADTRKRIRSTTWLVAAAATGVSALFGVLFVQPDPASAAAEPARSPELTGSPDPGPSQETAPDPHLAPTPTSAAPPRAASTPHHRAHRSVTPPQTQPQLRPPAQLPQLGTGSGSVTSGAS